MLYKLINGRPEAFTGRYIKRDGMVYANPTDEQLRADGYKPLVLADPPEVTDTQYAVDAYTETDTAIVQSWTVKDVEEEIIPETFVNDTINDTLTE